MLMNRRIFFLTPGIALVPSYNKAAFTNSQHKPCYRPKAYTIGLERIIEAAGGFKPGKLILLASRPSLGKTSLVYGISNHLVQRNNYSVLHLLARRTGSELLSRKLGSWAFPNSMIFSNTTTPTTRYLIEKECRMVSEVYTGLDLIIIDHLNEFYQQDGSPTEAREMLDWIKSLAVSLQTSIIVTASLSIKAYERNDSHPRISDLLFDHNIPSQVDFLILLYRDEIYQNTSIVDSENYDLKGITEVNIINAQNLSRVVVNSGVQK